MATLPNETKTYTFTACYNGNGNYTGSKADCQVRVTADHSQTGGGSGGSSGGSSSGYKEFAAFVRKKTEGGFHITKDAGVFIARK